MSNISGNVFYASTRYGSVSNLSSIPNVPIVVQNTTSGVGIAVLTDIRGNYTVTNVPNGGYRIVEAYGTAGAVSSPVVFPSTTIVVPTPKDPPLSIIPVTLANTNTVDSLSPNTLYVTITGTSILNQNFIDSSIQNNPLSLPSGISFGSNILTYAGNGIWGTLPAGAPINTIPTVYPYTNSMVSSMLIYTNALNIGSGSSIGGENHFSQVNIAVFGWFCAPNHTTFDETSSYIIVNGGDPNALLFQQTIGVDKNTFYLASAWLMMVTNSPGTSLIGFRVLGQDGLTVLFYGQTSNILYAQWGQIGQIFNTGNNSQVTIQVLTMSSAAGGNDFALDDVQLQKVSFDNNVTFNKYVDKPICTVGSNLRYTSVVTSNINLFNIKFQDTLPVGSTFNTGSVNISGTTYGGYNPQLGFTIPNMSSGGITTITFDATVSSVPSGNILNNKSNITYSTAIIPGNTITDTIYSSTIPTLVQYASLSSVKATNKNYSTMGDTLTYTITIANTGNVSASSILFKDTIPKGTAFVDNSFVLNGSTLPGLNPSVPIDIGTLPAGGMSTVTFSVIVNTIPSPTYIINSSNSTFNMLVDSSLNTIPKGSSNSNIVSTQFNMALLNTLKSVNNNKITIGDILTYTIAMTNSGNTTANNIMFIDTIPNSTSIVSGSLKLNGSPISGNPNPPGINIGSIGVGSTSTVSFQVTVNTIPSPNPITNSASTAFSYVVDPTLGTTAIGSSNSNTTNSQINYVIIQNITKDADKAFVTFCDIITYTITIPNSGNVTAINVYLHETIPNGTVYVSNSLKVNGSPSSDSISNINVGAIAPGSASSVTFSVQVTC